MSILTSNLIYYYLNKRNRDNYNIISLIVILLEKKI